MSPFMFLYNVLPGKLRAKLQKSETLRDIFENTAWQFIDKFLKLSIGMVVNIFVARYLMPSQFGLINFAISFSAILAIFSSMGLHAILVRDIVRSDSESDGILGSAAMLRLIGSCIGFAGSLVIIGIMRPGDSVSMILIAVFAFANFSQVFQILEYWFQAKMLIKYVTWTNTVVQIFFAALKILLIFLKAPLLAFASAFAGELVFCNLVLLPFYWINHRKIKAWVSSWSRMKSQFGQSWRLILSALAAIIYLKIDQVMLGQLISDQAVGIYAVAARISEVWYFVPNAIALAVFPALVRTRDKNFKTYEKRMQQLYDMLAMLALAIAIPITFFATPIVVFLFGPDYHSAGPILSVHIWAGIFIFMRALLSKWLIAEHLYTYSLVTQGSGAIVNVVLNFILIPLMGIMGAAIATVIAYASSSYFSLFLTKRTIPAGIKMTKSLVFPIRFIIKLFWRS